MLSALAWDMWSMIIFRILVGMSPGRQDCTQAERRSKEGGLCVGTLRSSTTNSGYHLVSSHTILVTQ